MKIIIVGCGEVGESLATQLVEEENNISEINEDKNSGGLFNILNMFLDSNKKEGNTCQL